MVRDFEPPRDTSRAVLALTFWRPWPYAILNLGKGVENRNREDGRMPPLCKYRGWLLLHAGSKFDREGYAWILETFYGRDPYTGALLDGAPTKTPPSIAAKRLDEKGIVGRARVVGHIEPVGHPHKGAFGSRQHTRPQAVLGDRDPRRSGEPGHHRGGGAPDSLQVAAPNEALLAIATGLDLRWYTGGYGLIFSDVERLDAPIPCRGRQNLWRPSADVLAKLPAGWDERGVVEHHPA